jgi:hypothetical protein
MQYNVPAMADQHTVVQGEDIGSIAMDHGYHPDTIWNDDANRALRDLRKDPFILMPGDVVVLPDKHLKSESAFTGGIARFRREGAPVTINLVLRDTLDKPRDQCEYTVSIDGRPPLTRKTGPDGLVTCSAPANAKQMKLTLLSLGPQPQEYVFDLATLDPITEVSGVQGRLANLGYFSDPIDNILGASTQDALSSFQASYELPITGQPDDATRDKLQSVYGS